MAPAEITPSDGGERRLRAATRAVIAGRSHEPGGPVSPGIAMTSTFRHGGPDIYARDDNDTWEAFEGALGDLEGGTALAFSSGMAAISAVLETLPIAATVVIPEGCYNGTTKWCADAAARGRLVVHTVDVTDTSAVAAASEGAALIWLESPTNPMLDIADIAPIAEAAHACGALVGVDNTLATPLRQQPLALGADVVVHSVTKWIAGHSDLLMGVAATADSDLLGALRSRRSLYGGIAGSFEAWLALRGLRTLPARLDRAEASAGVLAARLETHPSVDRVRYPGLESHPGHAVGLRQMTGPGAMVSIEVRGGTDGAEAVTAALEVLTPGTSLGGVETLIERRRRYSFEEATPPTLLRMSVGQEDVEDLWEDLDRALHKAAG